MMALEGASFGLQLGGQATDFVLLLMSPNLCGRTFSPARSRLVGMPLRQPGRLGAMLLPKRI